MPKNKLSATKEKILENKIQILKTAAIYSAAFVISCLATENYILKRDLEIEMAKDKRDREFTQWVNAILKEEEYSKKVFWRTGDVVEAKTLSEYI